MAKCPHCKNNLDDSIYEQKGVCAECGTLVQLSPKEESNRIRDKLRRELAQKKPDGNSYKKIQSTSVKAKEPNEPTKTVELNETSGKSAVSKNTTGNKDVLSEPPVATESGYANRNLADSVKPPTTALPAAAAEARNKEIDSLKENAEPKTADGNKGNAQAQTQTKPEEDELNNEVEDINFLTKYFSRIKEEKLETDIRFDFNKDGFYDDTTADVPEEPDVIQLSAIFRGIAFVACLFVAIIIVIYYV